jgi:hypothetical protein
MRKYSIKQLFYMFIFCICGFGVAAETLTLKQSAPVTYTVKKNDTLWHIANMFLEKPWLWPDLWRKNTQVMNPHLIYPGDVLTIEYIDGEPVLAVVRDKAHITLSPNSVKTVKSSEAINVLPWSVIAPYIGENEIVDKESFENLPHLLGNKAGAVRFTSNDLVLSRRIGRAKDQYRVVRKHSIIRNLEGDELGVQLHHIANASMVEDNAADEWLVKISDSNVEAMRGDKLMLGAAPSVVEMQLQGATEQRGFIVGNLHQYELLGKYDVVIVDLGSEQVQPGTVMGMYAQGPTIIDGETPKYETESNVVLSTFDDGSTVHQPALKIGELIIFSTFDKASYGIITRASDIVRKGTIVAKP